MGIWLDVNILAARASVVITNTTFNWSTVRAGLGWVGLGFSFLLFRINNPSYHWSPLQPLDSH